MKQLTLTIILLSLLVFGLLNLLSLPVLADGASCYSEKCRCSCTGQRCSCSAGGGSCYCTCFNPSTQKPVASKCEDGQTTVKSKDRYAM